MNEMQINYLNAMSIPIWQTRDRKQSPNKPEVLCILCAKDWVDANHQALFRKIMQALQWEDSFYETVVLSTHQILETQKQWILFGDIENVIINFDAYQKKWIKIPSLERMHNAQDAKREAWQRLKPYQRKA